MTRTRNPCRLFGGAETPARSRCAPPTSSPCWTWPRATAAPPPHPPTLPQELPCPLLCLRLLVAFPGGSGGDLWVLLSSAAPPRLPVVPWGAHPPRGRRALRLPALQLLRGCMRADPPAVSVGLLGLQHRAEGPGGADGLCLNVLLSVEPPRAADGPPPLRDPEWRWGRVEEEGLKGRILQRVRGGGTVPIRS